MKILNFYLRKNNYKLNLIILNNNIQNLLKKQKLLYKQSAKNMNKNYKI